MTGPYLQSIMPGDKIVLDPAHWPAMAVGALRDALAPPGAELLAQAQPERAPALWSESLDLVRRHVPFRRLLVRRKMHVYHYRSQFERLYLVHSGFYKVSCLSVDGREKPCGLKFKGDWLGLDGIAQGAHDSAAVALETGELWAVRYDDLLRAAAREPRLMHVVLAACSGQLARNREATLSVTTLSADARVAEFLLQWAHNLMQRGMQAEPVSLSLPLARADMGAYLGLRLESVSRSLGHLCDAGLIIICPRKPREIRIPDLASLAAFAHSVPEFNKPGLH